MSPSLHTGSYHFQRPKRIDNELKIWESYGMSKLIVSSHQYSKKQCLTCIVQCTRNLGRPSILQFVPPRNVPADVYRWRHSSQQPMPSRSIRKKGSLARYRFTGPVPVGWDWAIHQSRKADERAYECCQGDSVPRHDTVQTRGPLTMQYYHVDPAENDIYQHWVNLLGPTMGGAWMPVIQGNRFLSSRAQIPTAPGTQGITFSYGLPADVTQPVELPAGASDQGHILLFGTGSLDGVRMMSRCRTLGGEIQKQQLAVVIRRATRPYDT